MHPQGMSGATPPLQQLQAALARHPLYVYCGHGSGEQYVPLPALRTLPRHRQPPHAHAPTAPACASGSSGSGQRLGGAALQCQWGERDTGCASGLLMGCSSGRLRLQGAYDPAGAALGLLLAGEREAPHMRVK